MPKIRIPKDDKCPHKPRHAVWQSADKSFTAVCKMRDTHLLNAMRKLQKVVEENSDELSDEDVAMIDGWIDIFDRECSRRFRSRVQR